MVGAISPALAAVLPDRTGPSVTLGVLEFFALVNVCVALMLFWNQRGDR